MNGQRIKRRGDTRPLGVAAFWIRIIGGSVLVLATLVVARKLPEKEQVAAYLFAFIIAARVALYLRNRRG